MAGRFAACIVLGLFAATACGGTTRANATGGSGGAAGESGTGRDAAADASACASLGGSDALGPPQVVASGRSGIAGLGTSSAGPVWLQLENDPQVFVGSAPAEPVYEDPHFIGTNVADFFASNGWFAFDYQNYFPVGDPYDILIGNVAGAPTHECLPPGDFPAVAAIDGSYLYALWYDEPVPGALPVFSGVDRIALGAGAGKPCSSESSPTYHFWAAAVAVDRANVYFYAVPETYTSRQYSIRAMAKSGGAPAILATGRDPEPESPYGPSVSLRASNGTVAWVDEMAGPAHFVQILPRGTATPRTAVHEPGGVWGIALDRAYLYWTTSGGDIKREPICGGAAQVLATNQDEPMDIAVDDNGVYWLDHGTQPGTGKVMEMKKLGASQTDAGVDASLDASGETDASATDTGVPDVSDGGE